MNPRVFAWSVHLFTSLGLVCAAGMAVQIFEGRFEAAFALMLLATLIDALDGSLARWARVGKILPEFDGRRLDDLIDFQTYTSLPLLLMWRAGLAPGPWLILPLLASAYGFCRKQAKTDDGYFLGFPSYWNIVAFYCYFLPVPAVPLVVILSVLTFVPTRYLYPSQNGTLNRLTNILAAPWVAMLVAICAGYRALALASLYFPVFYMGASFWVSLRLRVSASKKRPLKSARTSPPPL